MSRFRVTADHVLILGAFLCIGSAISVVFCLLVVGVSSRPGLRTAWAMVVLSVAGFMASALLSFMAARSISRTSDS